MKQSPSMNLTKFTFKPVEVEGFRFSKESEITGPDWFGKAVREESVFIDRKLLDGAAHVYGCSIKTSRGWIHAKLGDYIMRSDNGDIFPVMKRTFKKYFDYKKGGENNEDDR